MELYIGFTIVHKCMINCKYKKTKKINKTRFRYSIYIEYAKAAIGKNKTTYHKNYADSYNK